MPRFEGVKYIRSLEQCSTDMVEEVGTKNAVLGELIRAGFNIPLGFAITTAAYAEYIRRAGLQDRIEGKLSSAHIGNLEEVSQGIRGLMEASPMPEDVEDEIGAAYDDLVAHLRGLGELEPTFAVRSSSTAEDSPSASFAGQFDTFLSVGSREGVIEAAKECWSSLFTARAIAYRNHRGTLHEESLMSVGVQRMVNAKTAGVIFTLDPVTGSRASIVLNANWGLGESVVKGMANVDSFTVNKVTLSIVKREVATKQLQSIVNDDRVGLVSASVPPELQDVPCLTDSEIGELAKQARLIERYYGRPQDIEFAIDKCLEHPKGIFITQSRPETRWSAQAKPIMEPKGHIAEHLVDWFRR
jgi:pyruvate,water dikinase